MFKFTLPAVFAILLIAPSLAEAADFRSIRPIARDRQVIQPTAPAATPSAGDQQVPAPDGAGFVPVDPAAVRIAFTNLLEKWNQPAFARAVERSLFDGARLMEILFQNVPRNATLRVLNVVNITTLDQTFIEVNGETLRSSIVTLTANTQVEFVDQNGNFRRRDGTNDFLIRVKTRD